MATFRKRGNAWRAEVFKNGVRKSKTFPTKSQAQAWAIQIEGELLSQKRNEIPDKTFSDLLDKYSAEISEHKKGKQWEQRRILYFKKYPFAEVKLQDLDEEDFKKFRDARLREVSSATVIREFNLLSHICSTAVKEWKWLKTNPTSIVQRPKQPKSRDRLITQEEIDALLFSANFTPKAEIKTAMQRVACAFLFAIETAMRAGEIVKLKWEDVDVKKRIANLYDTKNGADRTVPLSSEAIRILNQLPKESDFIFNLTSQSLDALFRKLKSRCGIENLHFHDTRHEAITRLAKKLDVLPLARMVGHRDLKMLMVYYNETAEELAKKLD